MYDLRSFTPTLCNLLKIPVPSLAKQPPITEILSHSTYVKRMLIYCPDAFGFHALKKLPDLYRRIKNISTSEVELSSVYPPKTPVCFASLFTGGNLEDFGKNILERPVLKCDTVFDALIRTDKKIAIVAVNGSSIDRIFREREIEYHSMKYDPHVTAKVLELLEQKQHDVIIAYHQEYDDMLHATGPFSDLALNALQRHTESWEYFVNAARRFWKKDYFLAFTPDHGGHAIETNKGNHGDDCPEDMQLRHFFVSG